jgi:LemA protein
MRDLNSLQLPLLIKRIQKRISEKVNIQMYTRNMLFAVMMVTSALAGCNAKQHAEDLGFKQGDNLVEKGVIKHDVLVDKDEDCNAAWADYESNLQRRADMIPQLVSVVKASSAHEETTLVAIAQAQANATRPEIKLDPKNDDLSNPEKFAAFQQAQSTLGTQLSRLLVQAPAQYPQLATSPQFHDLQIQVEGTENRLLRAREVYNHAAREYNTELRHVSGIVINPLTHNEFKPRVYFTADDSAKQAPKLDFGTPAAAPAITPATTR